MSPEQRPDDPHRRLAALTSVSSLGGGPAPRPGEPATGDEASAWRSWVEEEGTPERPGPVPAAGGRASGLRRWLPASMRGARVDPGRRGAALLALVAAVAAVVAAVGVWGSRPQAEPITALPAVAVVDPSAAAGTTAPASSQPAADPVSLVVSVTGKVVHPGLVTVPDGARVADVLVAAGGALPGVDTAALNLARKVADGEQVAVGVPAAPDALPAAGGAVATGAATGAAAPGGPLDLNSATVGQLDGLPGVGPVTAQRIVEWRTRNGRFARVEQLREVEGIGERRFEQLRGLVRV